MSVNIITRAGKGSKLLHSEMDANFTNLKSAVEDIQLLLGDPAGDVNTVIDKLREAMPLLDQFLETEDLKELLNNKISTSKISVALNGTDATKVASETAIAALKELIDGLSGSGAGLTRVVLADSEIAVAWNFSEGNAGFVDLTLAVAVRGLVVSNIITAPGEVQTGLLEVLHTVPGTSLALDGDSSAVAWNTTAGGTTLLSFYYNGTKLIWDSTVKPGNSNADTQSPSVENLRILSSNPLEILGTCDEMLLGTSIPDLSCFTPSDGRNPTYLNVNGVTFKLGIDVAYPGGSTPNLQFTPAANPLKDLSGNPMAGFTKTIILGDTDPVPYSPQEGIIDAGSGILLFEDGQANVGSYAIPKLKNTIGSYFEYKIPADRSLSSGVVVGLGAGLPANFVFGGYNFEVMLYNSGPDYIYRKDGIGDTTISGIACDHNDIVRFEVLANNNIGIKISKDGASTFAQVAIAESALLGITEAYIVAINAVAGNNKRILNGQIKNL